MSVNRIREHLMKNNFSLAILSILIAILVWFIISMTQYPSVQKTIANIPLSVDITGSAAESNGLSVISCNVEEVTVELLSTSGRAAVDGKTLASAGDKAPLPEGSTLELSNAGYKLRLVRA